MLHLVSAMREQYCDSSICLVYLLDLSITLLFDLDTLAQLCGQFVINYVKKRIQIDD